MTLSPTPSLASRRSLALVAAALVALACGSKREQPGGAAGSAAPASASPTASPATTAPTASAAPQPRASASGSASALPRASAAPQPSGPPPPFKGGIQLDAKPVDIATGAFVALGAVGAMIRRIDGEVLLVRLGDKITPLSDDGKLYTRGRSAVIDRGEGSALYWVSDGRLRRRLIDADGKVGSAEALADDVEDGTVPHGARNEGGAVSQDVVAYVARKRTRDGERQARVWVEGKGSRDLSTEGSGAASTWVTAMAPGRLIVAWNDARSALTPLHAAPVDLDGAGEPTVGAETTLWMGSPSETFPSLSAVRVEDKLVTLLALPRNGVDFGLAAVPVAFGERPRDDASWLVYPNGLDPAPVVPARFCGQPMVALVRPTERPPSAPKAVELASVEPSGRVTPRLEVAREGRVDHLTAWVSPKGDGWVAWVGDGRTKVRRVRCGKGAP